MDVYWNMCAFCVFPTAGDIIKASCDTLTESGHRRIHVGVHF